MPYNKIIQSELLASVPCKPDRHTLEDLEEDLSPIKQTSRRGYDRVSDSVICRQVVSALLKIHSTVSRADRQLVYVVLSVWVGEGPGETSAPSD